MNKLVKKLLSLTLVVAMCSSTSAVLADDAIDDAYAPYPVVSHVNLGLPLTNPSIAAWDSYVFIAHRDGVKVVDLQTEEIIADWKLDNIPGVNSFTPRQLYIDDNYIVVAGTSGNPGVVLVYENSKRFDNTQPTLIRRFTNTKMREVKKVYVDEDENLYIFDISSSLLEGWKIPLADLENIPTTGTASNKYTELNSNSTAYGHVVLTLYDSIWSDIEISKGWAYIPTFNNEGNMPYKTMWLMAVDLENFSADNIVTNTFFEGNLDAAKATFIIPKMTDAQIRKEAQGFFVDNPSEKFPVTTGKISKTELRMKITNIDSDYSMVQAYLTNLDDAESGTPGAASKLGVKADQIRSGKKVFALEIGGEEHQFKYEPKTEYAFLDGSFIIVGSKFYLMSDAEGIDSMIYGELNQGVCENVYMTDMGKDSQNGGNSGFTGAVLTGNHVLGFIRGLETSIFGIDLTKVDENYYGACQIRQYTGEFMTTSNPYSDLVEYNGSIYFVNAGANKLVHLLGKNQKESVSQQQAGNKLPAVFYGTTKNDAEINVTIDGEDIAVPVQNNIWRLPIAAQTNGAHTVSVGGQDLAYNVDVQPIITASNVVADDTFAMDVVTNLEDYGYNANTLYVGVNKVKADGSVVSAGADVAVTDGTPATVNVAVDNTDAAKYEIYVFVKGEQLTPIAKYTYQNGAMVDEAPAVVLGNANKITVDSVTPDNLNRVAKITGEVANGGARLVVAKLDCDHGTTFASAISDATGAYTITAPYICDNADIGDATSVNVYAQLSSAVGSESYSALDEEEVAAIIAQAQDAITDAASFRSYLTTHADFAEVIGVDLEQEDFANLNPDNQTAVLNKVVALLKADGVNAIPDTFETESKATLTTQRTEDALDKISKASSSTLTAILSEYKKELGISDDLWEDYDDLTNTKKLAANEYFLDKVKINNPAGIPGVLEDAVDEAEDPSVTPTKRPSRDTGGSPGISIAPVSTPKPTTTPAPTPTPTTEPTGFVDLAGYEWAEESINALAELGIITGVGDNKFAPGNNVTREQFVTMLVKAAGLDNTDAVSTFTDVNPDDWFYTSVAMGEEAGLVAGSDGKFGVGKKISRQDMAVFIYRAGVSLGVEFDGQKLDYVDAAEISDYALEAVGAVSAAGIMSGVGDNTFAPKGDCTRAMAARVIYGLLQLMK